MYHIQNVNAYHSRLKGWMDRFKGVTHQISGQLYDMVCLYRYNPSDFSVAHGNGVFSLWLVSNNKKVPKVRYKSDVPTGTCAICHEPIIKGQEVGAEAVGIDKKNFARVLKNDKVKKLQWAKMIEITSRHIIRNADGC